MTSQLVAVASRRTPTARLVGRGADKTAVRRTELAEAALETLADLGYARTSLREIAQNSEFTHGVLHYYFTDKVDLICCCVRHYKAKCVTRYDKVTATARTREQLLEAFLQKLDETLRMDARMHRLWYDLRSQALFEDVFREDVKEIDQSLENMIWRIASRYAELGDKTIAISKKALYAVFDSLFQRHLMEFLSGNQRAGEQLKAEVRAVLPLVA